MLARHIVATGCLGFDEPVVGNFSPAANGRTYAAHEFGNALLLLPLASASHVVEARLMAGGASPGMLKRFREFFPPFVGSLYAAISLAVLGVILNRHFGLSRRSSFIGTLLVGTTTFVWTYSRMLYDCEICGTLLVGSLLLLLEYKKNRRLGSIAASFALLGLGVATRLSMVIPVIASGVYVFLLEVESPARAIRAAAVAGLALAPFAVWQLWYNHLRTGHPLISPVQMPQFAINNALDGRIIDGVTGLLFSPGKSLFVYAPLLVLAVGLFPRFAREHRPEAAYLAVLATLWLLLHAKLRSWWGAWGWGPRHFVTVVPVLLLPALVALPTIRRSRAVRGLVIGLGAAGFLLAAASLISNWHYREELAAHRLGAGGLEGPFIWSASRSQAVDMLFGAARNVAVCLGRAAPEVVADTSPANVMASNTINFWWVTLVRSGIPVRAVAPALAALLAGVIVSFAKAWDIDEFAPHAGPDATPAGGLMR